MKSILAIVQKEFKMELRQKSTLMGVFLYLFSIVLLIYSMQGSMEPIVWNTFLWVTALFITMNAVAKSFIGESKNEWQYNFTIYHPAQFLLGKLLYSALMMLLVGGISLLTFRIFFSFPVNAPAKFILFYLLGTISFSILFTFLSAIVAKVNNNPSLLAILGLPLVLTFIILLSDMSQSFFDVLLVKGWNNYLLGLIGLDFIMVLLGVLLYPVIWKD
jgi:heme exporter protein B